MGMITNPQAGERIGDLLRDYKRRYEIVAAPGGGPGYSVRRRNPDGRACGRTMTADSTPGLAALLRGDAGRAAKGLPPA